MGVAVVVSMMGLVVFDAAVAGLVIRPSISSLAIVGIVVGAAMAGDTVGEEELEVGATTGD